MSHTSREKELSLLAQGRGFYNHGIQVECFVDDFKAYSLSGRPLIQPSASGTGRSCKPYRSHTLTLPKTYVTKRGQMVLFTAPEDMIFGQSCAVHQKEVVCKKTVQELKTTRNFVDSAMTFGNADAPIYENSWTEPGAWSGQKGAWQDKRDVKAGHFTDVYLRSLQKATADARSKACDDITVVEDLEENDLTLDSSSKKPLGEIQQMEVDSHLIPECDSGLGHSLGHSPSGRLSGLSQRSDLSAVISIPHGSKSEEEEVQSPLAEASPGDLPGSKEEDGGLAALKQELAFYKVKGARSTTDPKKLGKTGKKRQHPKSSAAKTGLDAASTVTSAGTSKPRTKKSNKIASNKTLGLENPSVSKLGHAKPSKVKKRRGKKQLHSQEDEDANPMVVEGGAVDDGSRMGREDLLTAVQGNVTEDQGHLTGNGFGGGLEVTAVQLGIGEGAVSPSVSKNRRASRAEERKLEIERKRLERRELERLRKQAEEEERRLKEEKEMQSKAAQDLETNEEMGDSIEPTPSPEPRPPSPPTLATNQQQLLDALERAKLRENALLLSLRMESSDRQLTEEMKSVEEAVERARQAAEEVERKREEEERIKREEEERLRAEEEKKRLEEEALQAALDIRAHAIQTKSARLRSECMQSVATERRTKRYQGTVAPSIMFSYFSYVPPPGSRQKSAADTKPPKRGQRPQTIRSK